MQAAALQRTDLGVRHVPDLVVAEIKGDAAAVWLACSRLQPSTPAAVSMRYRMSSARTP